MQKEIICKDAKLSAMRNSLAVSHQALISVKKTSEVTINVTLVSNYVSDSGKRSVRAICHICPHIHGAGKNL